MTVIIYSEKSIDSLRPYIYEYDHDYIMYILRNTPPFMVNIGLIIKGNGCSNKMQYLVKIMLFCKRSALLWRTIGTIHNARMLMSTTISKVASRGRLRREIADNAYFRFHNLPKIKRIHFYHPMRF